MAKRPTMILKKTFLPRNIQGGLWKIGSCSFFAFINGGVRFLSWGATALPAHEVAFLQTIVSLLVVSPWMGGRYLAAFQQSQCKLFYVLRGAFASIGVMLWYITLAIMPMSQGMLLASMGPVFTTIGAYIFLNEPLFLRHFLAIGFNALAIVLFVYGKHKGPFISTAFHIGEAMIPVGSSLAFSLSTLLGKKIAQKDHPMLLSTYALVFTLPFLGVMSLWHWHTPTWGQGAIVCVLGFLGALAHVSASKALALAHVVFLIPFGAWRFLCSALIGWFFFQEKPDIFVAAGALLVAINLLLLSYGEKKSPTLRNTHTS